MVKQLEEGLKDIDLVRVRRLQVVEITKGILELMDSASPVEESSNDGKRVLLLLFQDSISLCYPG